MLIYLVYFNLLLCVAQINAKVFNKGPLLDDNVLDVNNDSHQQWDGLWFPHPPNYHNDLKVQNVNVASVIKKSDPLNSGMETQSPRTQSNITQLFPHPPGMENQGNITQWFPHPPGKENQSNKTLWFPHPPGEGSQKLKKLSRGHHFDDFLEQHECDNGKTNIAVDFDPEDKRHSYNYLCLANRTKYEPNMNTTALLMEHLVPPAYQPAIRCLSEKLTYDEAPPTFGPYRPLAPKFGAYKYLPPQRWLHSLSDGAIVLLYHPCTFSGQIKQLQNILQGCLYRHIITPSQLLTPERPLALLAWGKCLQMSVVDDNLVVQFIKENAKLGLHGQQNHLQMSSYQYDAGLLSEAHLVTDEQDKEICGYKEDS